MPLGGATLWVRSMCNLYSMTTNQKAIRDLFKVGRDTTSSLPPMPAVAFAIARRFRLSDDIFADIGLGREDQFPILRDEDVGRRRRSGPGEEHCPAVGRRQGSRDQCTRCVRERLEGSPPFGGSVAPGDQVF